VATCAACGQWILFGGVTRGEQRFCGDRCERSVPAGYIVLTREEIDEALMRCHHLSCPQCQGPGPIDVHVGHRIVSALLASFYDQPMLLACRDCGARFIRRQLLLTALAGWWSLPGLAATPVYIWRNLCALRRIGDGPSEMLRTWVINDLADRRGAPQGERTATERAPDAAGAGSRR
jgi:hypothetical protein